MPPRPMTPARGTGGGWSFSLSGTRHSLRSLPTLAAPTLDLDKCLNYSLNI